MWTLHKLPKRQRPHLTVEFVAHGPFSNANEFREKVMACVEKELAHFREYYSANGGERLARLAMHTPLVNQGVYPSLESSTSIASASATPTPIIPPNATLYQASFGIVSPENEKVFSIFATVGLNHGLAKAWASYLRRQGLPRDVAGEESLAPKREKSKAKRRRKRQPVKPKSDGLREKK